MRTSTKKNNLNNNLIHQIVTFFFCLFRFGFYFSFAGLIINQFSSLFSLALIFNSHFQIVGLAPSTGGGTSICHTTAVAAEASRVE